MYVWVMFFLVFYQQIGLQVVLWYCKVIDIDNVVVFVFYLFGYMFYVFSSEFFVIDDFYILVGVWLFG